jgi:hypothetical protein
MHPGRDADTAAGFLNRFLAHFPHPVHTILTDNGSELPIASPSSNGGYGIGRSRHGRHGKMDVRKG